MRLGVVLFASGAVALLANFSGPRPAEQVALLDHRDVLIAMLMAARVRPGLANVRI